MSLRDWVSAHPIGQRGTAIARIAEATAVTPAAVRHWLSGLRDLPADKCPLIETAIGVSCEALRPDLRWERNEQGRVTGYRVPLLALPAASPLSSEAQ